MFIYIFPIQKLRLRINILLMCVRVCVRAFLRACVRLYVLRVRACVCMHLCVRSYMYFHHTLAESATFPPCSETGIWYFRPGYDEK